uniref:Putative secreted protein n=1 Tax=Anopheles triannulatus TaxID=58253 RepID=A0A2M4B5K8_9DIPT
MSRNLLVPLLPLLVVLSVVLTVEGETYWDSNCDIMKEQLKNINWQIDQQAKHYNLRAFDQGNVGDRLYTLLETLKQWQLKLDKSVDRVRFLLYTKMQELAIPRGYESVTDSFEKVFQKFDDRNARQQSELNVRLNEIEILKQQKQNMIEQLQSLKDNRTVVKRELEAMNKIISDLTTDKQKLEAKINGNPPAVRG